MLAQVSNSVYLVLIVIGSVCTWLQNCPNQFQFQGELRMSRELLWHGSCRFYPYSSELYRRSMDCLRCQWGGPEVDRQYGSIKNWPNSQIPECTYSLSHNAPFRTEMCKYLFWIEHSGIWNWCILGFVKLVYWCLVPVSAQPSATLRRTCHMSPSGNIH